MEVLVDTCTFLWISADSPCLSKTAAAVFPDRNNERYLSSASAWEIGAKDAAGRLPLPERVLPAGRLPALHSDPFDRMFVAKAMARGMTILTPETLRMSSMLCGSSGDAGWRHYAWGIGPDVSPELVTPQERALFSPCFGLPVSNAAERRRGSFTRRRTAICFVPACARFVGSAASKG
jgi:PIN domain nuclease of toxin-antitoxin system